MYRKFKYNCVRTLSSEFFYILAFNIVFWHLALRWYVFLKIESRWFRSCPFSLSAGGPPLVCGQRTTFGIYILQKKVEKKKHFTAYSLGEGGGCVGEYNQRRKKIKIKTWKRRQTKDNREKKTINDSSRKPKVTQHNFSGCNFPAQFAL